MKNSLIKMIKEVVQINKWKYKKIISLNKFILFYN